MSLPCITLEAPGRFTAGPFTCPEPAAGEALVRVHRVGVCGTDLHAFRGRQPFFTYPRVLGHELGVEVVAIGEGVSSVAVGDRCSVEPYLNCGGCMACRRGRPNCCERLAVLGVHRDGGMCSHLTLPAAKLHPSRQLGFDQLALVETLAIGAHAVERASPEPGEVVLVIGAGPIGLATIQFAQAAGAEVVVMDVNETRLAFCRERLRVTRTLVATDDDLESRVRAAAGGDLPTVVFDATGHAPSMERAFRLPAHGGRLVFVGLVQSALQFHDPDFHRRELTLLASRNALPDTFRRIIAQVESGRIDTTPWITHRLALGEVPARFGELAADGGLLKAMISVGESA